MVPEHLYVIIDRGPTEIADIEPSRDLSAWCAKNRVKAHLDAYDYDWFARDCPLAVGLDIPDEETAVLFKMTFYGAGQ